ncbi:uncharacterized protein LOC142351427 isoform X2 [Convolutriloba macropyga]|uniref:uncharacterized protein LOC142351427 isoform X2 n=1 Tax=Convolutriloba macropyga TaxID=536237 RepID=UPI003F526DF7
MDKYDNLGMVGEGSYGAVMKCRHKETNQLVAIKKFLESEDDKVVKKIAMREIKMLRQLQHDHLVNLLEVFRRKKRLYLVFEFVDHTVLDDLERNPHGLDETRCKKVLWQVLKGTEFCHSHNIIHRDIKPENILVSRSQVVKLCDFGFARTLAAPGEIYTDYVATRWYRAPELLVGDTTYGKAVDIWAIGCLLAEMLTGDPLFPGDSDIDQLHLIMKCFGPLHSKYKEIFMQNPLFSGVRLPEVKHMEPLEKKIPRANKYPNSLDFMKVSMRLDAMDRPSCTQLLRHPLFTSDGFGEDFGRELRKKIDKEKTDSNNLYKILKGERDTKKQSFAAKFQQSKNSDNGLKSNNKENLEVNNNNSTSVTLPVMKKQSPPRAPQTQDNKNNQKPHISPNLPNVHDKNPNTTTLVNQTNNQNDTLISDKQSVISKRSDNSRRVDPSMNPNPANVGQLSSNPNGNPNSVNPTPRVGTNGGSDQTNYQEPIKSPVKNPSSQIGTVPGSFQKQTTTMPAISSKQNSITTGNKQNWSTLAPTVTPTPPGAQTGGVPGSTTSPGTNKPGAPFFHNSPPNVNYGGMIGRSVGGSPKGGGFHGNHVQSVGSVVNINMDHLPTHNNHSPNVGLKAGISTLKRSYTNVYKKSKSTDLPTPASFDPNSHPIGVAHLPNGTSPRHDTTASLKLKEFKAPGVLGEHKGGLNSRGQLAGVGSSNLGSSSLQQRFSPPANFQSMSSNNFSHG